TDDLEIDEPQSDIVPIRRSTRTRHAPDRMCLYIDAEEHELGDLGEPAKCKATLLDPDKWLFKKKTDMDGVIHTYKARLVAKGYTQTPGIDYEETFSPDADIRAIRILIAIATYYDYEIWQMDVKTALRISMKRFTWSNLKSAKQSIFATSSAEVEYIAAFDASKKAVWVRKFIYGLGVTKGARHFRAKVHYLRDVFECGDVKLEKVRTYDNLTDPFTKALAFPKHSEHTRNIGMLLASSLM
nr:putative retrotransposon Ty1-copia subclass protein [Tanacetum cinerariifolium]